MPLVCRYQALARITLVLVIAIATCAPLAAQTTTASVAGTVKDDQGGVIPGATVTLTSATQGTVLTTVSDGQGSFVFASVRPDTYRLKVSLEGFTSVERPDIVVNANDRLAVPAIELKIGALTETVTVAGGTPEIQLRSGERAFTLQSETIQNIAVNGRSFFGLAFMVPGVVTTTDTPTQVSNLSANGQRANSNNMTIDGVANIDTGDNGGNMAQTNLDAIAEFKVLTSSYQAEYGRAVGAQVQVVTKSGTQHFNGTGYWYGRRSEWNANTWWNNRNGTALPKSARNDSGFSIGGPVVIPGVFNTDRKSLFFFFNQEFQRRKDPVGETRATVPTALERKGDFSQSVDSSGNPFPYIKDYTTGLPCNASNTSGCFADGGVLGRIPANRLYAATAAILNMYPQANTSGKIGYNYASQTAGAAPLNQSMFRADYQLGARWRLTGRYMQHSNKSELPYGISGWSVRSNLDDINVISDVPGRNWLASATGVLDNNTTLEISVGSAHNSLDHYATNEKLTLSSLQQAAGSPLPLLYPSAVQNDLVPEFTFAGRIANQPFYNTGQAPFTNFNTTLDILANLTKIIGSHATKAGFYFQQSTKPQSAFAYFNGRYQFDQNTNNPFDSGHPFANAALGVYNTFQQASSFLKPEWTYKNVEGYVQDNWRATDRLTLDYGARVYFMTPQWDTTGQASNFLPDEFVTANAVRLFQPAVINGVRVGYDATTGLSVNSTFIGRVVPGSGDRFQGTHQGGDGTSKTLTDGNKFKVSPRVGFAYDITGKESFVARGAFGIFYDRPQGNAVFDLITNPPGLQVSTLTWGLASQIGGTGTVAYQAPVSLNPNTYEWKVPTVYQWNFGVQMKLPSKFTLDIAYVGSESRNQLQQHQINALPYGTTYLDSSQDPTKGTCAGCQAPSTLPGGNALPTELLRPYQGYGTIRLWEFTSYSDYKALQNTLSRRFSKGVMFSFNYTRSSAKGLGNDDWSGARIDGKDREANYGPLGIDRPNLFVSSFVYQTPPVTASALKYLTNDWQISGNYRWMTGAPYAVGHNISGVSATNLTGSDQGARIIITGDTGKGYSDDPYKMFNTGAFTAPGPGSNGLESPRVYMVNPPTNNLDMSLSKSLPLGGKRRIEIRLDAFNALNHTQFSGVNTTANYSGLNDRTTITNLAKDASGKVVNQTGFGSVNGVRPPRQLQLMARIAF
jgi:hypothetical protein